MSRVTVIGLGYVGLSTAAGLAHLGHEVVGLDIDEERVRSLNVRRLPIFEPELEALLDENAPRLRFTESYGEALDGCEFAFLCVPTPLLPGRGLDATFVRAAAALVAEATRGPRPTIVIKSTVPPGTNESVRAILERMLPHERVEVVSNPEFTREGHAVADFLKPDRIVIGSAHAEPGQAVAELYRALGAPTLLTDPASAEMIKLASNAFLATKISFINEMATIADAVGADVQAIAEGMGLDLRIGSAFLQAGAGFGGSCLPKDVAGLAHLASLYGAHPELLRAVLEVNRAQRRLVVRRLREGIGPINGRTICLLGLAFKPGTDDVRGAPARDIIELLRDEGALLRAYDPLAGSAFSELYEDLRIAASPYEAAADAEAVVVVTEWPEFAALDPARLGEVMRTRFVLDARNCLDASAYEAEGFRYVGIGRLRARVAPSAIDPIVQAVPLEAAS